MLNKEEVLKKYLLWKKISGPVFTDGEVKYPHCLNCRYWDWKYMTCNHYDRWLVYATHDRDIDPNIKYGFDSDDEYHIQKCILAFVPGNWVKRD
jgi:hypothetical protein